MGCNPRELGWRPGVGVGVGVGIGEGCPAVITCLLLPSGWSMVLNQGVGIGVRVVLDLARLCFNPACATYSLCKFGQIISLSEPRFYHP